MPLALAMVLAGRGVTKQTVSAWLDPKISTLMQDPSILTDMDRTAERLAQAVRGGEKIGIFGDYDVDGACSAAVLHDVLTPLGCDVSIHIPDRFNEGYGPNLPALLKLKESGCSLIVTVDCGITAHGPIEAAVEAGVEVIIIDHHIAGPDLPKALAVVNPNRLEDDGSYRYLAAAGVCFLVMVALLRLLRNTGHFAETPEPNLMKSLDLVALATVCDVVPMEELNRAYIRVGLDVMARRQREGLAALADVSRLTSVPDVQALGFMLGPRINAGGRIGNSNLGVSLLTTRDPVEAARMAAELDALNTRRKSIEQDVTQAAIAQLEGRGKSAVMMAADDGWNQGVIGISAGRVKDHFGHPAAVISVSTTAEGTRIGKASARSIAPFRLGAAVIAAQQHGLLIAGGGHDMAAGFTIDMDKLPEFQDFMNQRAIADFGTDGPAVERQVDAPLSAGAADIALLNWMDKAGPFGSGFPEPRFMLSNARISGLRTMGAESAHMAMRISDGSGQVDAVLFRSKGTALGAALMEAQDGRPVHLLGRLNRNRYQGREKVQFMIEDMQDASP
ncbi:MAG: single-stranded-DNA-specific exonuclease RecJ [Alphaproteobacteria bacterium]|nr:single-stranded-DNA-specific exonuclease RecJ [Alphaproteobacteria bacterium]